MSEYSKSDVFGLGIERKGQQSQEGQPLPTGFSLDSWCARHGCTVYRTESSKAYVEYVENIFCHSLRKPCHQWKLRTTKRLLFNFWMLNLQLYQNKHLALENLVGLVFWMIKLKSKHLVLLGFLWQQVFFWLNEKKYFAHIPGLRGGSLYCADVDQFHIHCNSWERDIASLTICVINFL